MKTIIFLALIACLAFFMRINLPENADINKHISTQDQQKADPTIQFVGKALHNILYSDTIADWQFVDFIVVKYACSQNLKIQMIALPLKPWKIHKKDIQGCDDFSY